MGERTGYLSDANVKARCPDKFRPNFGQAYGLFRMSDGSPAQIPSKVIFYLKEQSKQTGVPYETLSKLYAQSVARISMANTSVPTTTSSLATMGGRALQVRQNIVQPTLGLTLLSGNISGSTNLRDSTADDLDDDLRDSTAGAPSFPIRTTDLPDIEDNTDEPFGPREKTKVELISMTPGYLSKGSKLRAVAPEFIPTDRKGITKQEIRDIGISLRPAINKLRKKFYEDEKQARGREALSSGLQPLIAVSARDKRASDRAIRAEEAIESQRMTDVRKEKSKGSASGSRTPPTSDSFLIRGQDKRLRKGLAFAQATETEARRNAPY